MVLRIISLIILVLCLAACQFSGVNIQRNNDGSTNITLALSESDVNGMVQTALSQTGNPLMRDPRVDLQPGKVVINGTHDRRGGGGTVSGSVDMTFSVQNGQVVPQVSAVNVEGLALNDERVALLNQRLAQGFAQRASRENNRATVTGINITNDQFEITLTVRGN